MVASERAINLAGEVLAKIAAFDPSFYKPSESIKLAWAEIISLKNPTREDMLAAVTRFYETNETGQKPLPATITNLARSMRLDRMMRGEYVPPRSKAADDDAPALPTGRSDEKITLAEWEARHGPFPRIKVGFDIPPEDADLKPLKVPCPHCKAGPGFPCHIPGTRDLLTKSLAHPSRMEAARACQKPSERPKPS